MAEGNGFAINKQTSVSIGLAIFVAMLIGGFAISVQNDITLLGERQRVIQADTDKIPEMERSLFEIEGTVNRIEALNDSSFGWKKPDMEVWCLRTERKNNGWVCADPYAVRSDGQ